MPNYQESKIYTIRCTTDDNLIHAGSTVERLSQRLAKHRYQCKKFPHFKIYQNINNDWDNWYIELYELYPCNTKEELLKREGEMIREIGTLNHVINGRTKKEYQEDNFEKIKIIKKKYNEEHLETQKEYQAIYRQNNAEKIIAYQKKYSQDAKEEIKKTQKEYREKNAEKIKEKKHKYYQDNIEKIALLTKEYIKKNKDKTREYQKEYQEKNAEKIKEKKHKNYIDKKNEKKI